MASAVSGSPRHSGGAVALRYYGGKSPLRGTCKWIVSHLPWRYDSIYVEPFCGMAGVLLSRQPVNCEIINDLNDRLINWWQCIRDHPDEFAAALDGEHRHSRTVFAAMRAQLDCDDPIRRAVAYTIVLLNTMAATDWDNGYVVQYDHKRAINDWTTDDIRRLRRRIANTQIENRDAITILERTADCTEAVVYVDPPYQSARNRFYRHVPDWDRLYDALRQQRGMCAVSGFGGDFSRLGWRVEERPRKSTIRNYLEQTDDDARVERLWMNYDPPQSTLFEQRHGEHHG